MFIGDVLELLGVACFAVIGFVIGGVIGALVVLGAFLLYQAHLGAHSDIPLHWPRINRGKRVTNAH